MPTVSKALKPQTISAHSLIRKKTSQCWNWNLGEIDKDVYLHYIDIGITGTCGIRLKMERAEYDFHKHYIRETMRSEAVGLGANFGLCG